jgi:hypothetical protein
LVHLHPPSASIATDPLLMHDVAPVADQVARRTRSRRGKELCGLANIHVAKIQFKR